MGIVTFFGQYATLLTNIALYVCLSSCYVNILLAKQILSRYGMDSAEEREGMVRY